MNKKLFCLCVLGISALFGKDPTIQVRTSANKSFSSDQFETNLSVVTQNAKSQDALQENSVKMRKVMEALKEVGVSEEEMQTGAFSLIPSYSKPPKNPPQDWRAEIIGYEARNTLSIKTANLALAAKILDTAVKNGANHVNDVAFNLKDPLGHRSEVIKMAVQNGEREARAAAEASGMRIKKVLEISVDPSNQVQPFFKRELMAVSFSDAATPLVPGQVDVRADVSITYEIEK